MSFGEPGMRKYCRGVVLGVKAGENSSLSMTCTTDRQQTFLDYEASSQKQPIAKARKLRLRPGKFTYMKLLLKSDSPSAGCTVVEMEIEVENGGRVR